MRRSGARDFTFDIDTGVGSLLLLESKPVDFGAIQNAVKDSGFDLLWIEARVRGILRTVSDSSGAVRPAVEVESPRQVFLLIEGTTEEERRGYSRLREAAEGRTPRVLVRGRIHAHAGAPPGLTVRDFRIDS